MIGDAGLIVPEGDVAALTRAIKDVRDRTALRDTLVARGRKRFLSHFTNESIASATVDVYRRLMEQQPSGASDG